MVKAESYCLKLFLNTTEKDKEEKEATVGLAAADKRREILQWWLVFQGWMHFHIKRR